MKALALTIKREIMDYSRNDASAIVFHMRKNEIASLFHVVEHKDTIK